MSCYDVFFKCDDGHWYRDGHNASFRGEGWFLLLDEDGLDELVVSLNNPLTPMEIVKQFNLPIVAVGNPGAKGYRGIMKEKCRGYRVTFADIPIFPAKLLSPGHKPITTRRLGTYLGGDVFELPAKAG